MTIKMKKKNSVKNVEQNETDRSIEILFEILQTNLNFF